MNMRQWAATAVSILVITAATLVVPHTHAQNRVFEMRTYFTHEGKLDDLMARFRNHTTKYFEKHGMTNVGYWVPRDQPHTLVYILAYPSREAATKA